MRRFSGEFFFETEFWECIASVKRNNWMKKKTPLEGTFDANEISHVVVVVSALLQMISVDMYLVIDLIVCSSIY